MKISCKVLFLLHFLFAPVADCFSDQDGYFFFAGFRCVVPSRELAQIEYLVDWYFNKELTMQYNSTVGKWLGMTPGGRLIATAYNDNEHDRLQRKMERQLICLNNVNVLYNVTEESRAQPTVSVGAVDQRSVLVCSAYDFYPKFIRMSWLRNGQKVTKGVTFSDALSNEDWTYQAHSYLEIPPDLQDQVSCVVEHVSLKEPKIYTWESSQSHSDRSYIAGGVSALILGGVILYAGVIKHKKKSCRSPFSSPM